MWFIWNGNSNSYLKRFEEKIATDVQYRGNYLVGLFFNEMILKPFTLIIADRDGNIKYFCYYTSSSSLLVKF